MKLSRIEREELEKYITENHFDEALKGKTLLITGAKGLIGTAITKWILLQNELKACDTMLYASTRNPEEIPDYIEKEDKIRYIPHGREAEFCPFVDFILHAASPVRNQIHMQYPMETFRTNVDGMERMLELCSRNKDCILLFFSSEEVYGAPSDSSPVVTEETVAAIDSLNLRSCYPLAKKACEFLAYSAAKEYHLKCRILRLSVTQGLYQPYEETRVSSEILRCILENKNLHMKSDGLSKKCMLYTLDAVTASFTVLLKGEDGEAYNATNQKTFLSIRDLAERLFQSFNPKLKIIYENTVNKSDGFLPHRSIVLDCRKLEALGWRAKADLEHIYRVDLDRFTEKRNGENSSKE